MFQYENLRNIYLFIYHSTHETCDTYRLQQNRLVWRVIDH